MLTLLKSALANIGREAWLRFFLTLAGLALAFAAAIFSAAAAQAGSPVASVIFASTALFLALLVGVLSVPFLLNRVVARRFRHALQFELTREGKIYLVSVLVIGVAALNTSNNLLYIVVAAMLAAIAVSGFFSTANLRGLELDVAVPSNAFAGRPVGVRVRLENPRPWLPSFSITVLSPVEKKRKRQRWEWQWEKTQFIFPKRGKWLQLPDYTLRRKLARAKPAAILTKPVYFTYIAPHSVVDIEVELTFPRRGQYSQDGFSLATRFPFSFLTKTRRVRLERELLVYPRLIQPDELLDVLPLITGEFVSFVRGQGSELYRIREHTPRDPARYVDWKATAKTGSLKVREFTREDERLMRVVFDNPEPGQVSEASYERAISLAATLACHFAGEQVDLSFAGPDYTESNSLDDFLRYLAPMQPAPRTWVLEQLPVSSDFNVILTARTPGSIPTPLWVTSYVIYM